jgi:hypothetical protein
VSIHRLPGLHIDVQGRHAGETAVVLEVIIRGRHLGPWRGLPATGSQIEFPLCGIFTFDNEERLAGEKIYYDRATVLRQKGVFYEPDCATGRITRCSPRHDGANRPSENLEAGLTARSGLAPNPKNSHGPLVTLATCDRWVFCSRLACGRQPQPTIAANVIHVIRVTDWAG